MLVLVTMEEGCGRRGCPECKPNEVYFVAAVEAGSDSYVWGSASYEALLATAHAFAALIPAYHTAMAQLHFYSARTGACWDDYEPQVN